MDPTIFGTAKADFEEEYVTYGRGPMKYSVVKYNHVPDILQKVDRHSFTCTADQAGLAGQQFWQSVPVTLPQKARHAYEEMAEEFITELESGGTITASNPAVKRLRLLQITGGFTTEGASIHRAKLVALRDMSTDLWAQREPLVVYCRFLPEVAAAAQVLEKVGYPTRAMTGKVKKGRSAIIHQFQTGPPSALVFQVQTGSVSIELSRAAEVVFYSPPDSWDLYFQALNRVMGPNQKRPVRYTHILARFTLDAAVMAALAAKEDMHATMLHSPRRFLLPWAEDYGDMI
jgi:SNF2 family DNA or RNA helicase